MPFNQLERNIQKCNEIYKHIRTHRIYVDYPTLGNFMQNLGTIRLMPESVGTLMMLYNGIKYYRDWIVDQTVKKIEQNTIQKSDDEPTYTANIRAGLGAHPKVVDEADPIDADAITLLITEIKAKVANVAREKRKESLVAFQNYVTAEMNRMHAGDYPVEGELDEIKATFEAKAAEALGEHVDDYNIAAIKAAMIAEFEANAKEMRKIGTNSYKVFISGEGLGHPDFWADFKTDSNRSADLTPENLVADILINGNEDATAYAIDRVKRNLYPYVRHFSINEKRHELLSLVDTIENEEIYLPEDEMLLPNDGLDDDLLQATTTFIHTVAENYAVHNDWYNIPTADLLMEAIGELAPDVKDMIWKRWSEIHYEGLIKNIRFRVPKDPNFDQANTAIVNLFENLDDLNLHPSVHDTYAMAWMAHNKITQIPIVDNAGPIAIARNMLSERYRDIANAPGFEGKSTAIAKYATLFATVNSMINTIKGSKDSLNRALGTESAGGREALDAAGETFSELFNIGSTFADFALTITGLNIGAAIGAIPGFVSEARDAIRLRKKAKDQRVEAEAALDALNIELEQEVNIHAVNLKKKGALESKIFALGVVVTKKLRQFIWDVVEILKRVLTICSTILKITGVAAIGGFVIDGLKTLINAIQQSYFLGRAIYKTRKGTKGVDRHAAADIFVNDAFDEKDKYAIEIILDTEANKGVENEHLAMITSVDAFKLQLVEIESNSEAEYLSCRKAINTNLFKALSSKPAASLARLLFPGSGFIKSFT